MSEPQACMRCWACGTVAEDCQGERSVRVYPASVDLAAELARRDRALAWLAEQLAGDRAAKGEGMRPTPEAVQRYIDAALAAAEEADPDAPAS